MNFHTITYFICSILFLLMYIYELKYIYKNKTKQKVVSYTHYSYATVVPKGISCHTVIIPVWIVHSWLRLLITPLPLPPLEASIAPSWPMKATQQGISQDRLHFSRSRGQCVWCLHTCLTIKFWRAVKNQDNIMYYFGSFLKASILYLALNFKFGNLGIQVWA